MLAFPVFLGYWLLSGLIGSFLENRLAVAAVALPLLVACRARSWLRPSDGFVGHPRSLDKTKDTFDGYRLLLVSSETLD